MIKLTSDYINGVAPNATALSNGTNLIKKGSFVKLNISEDETIIFGECKGSGASNYLTSADFIDESKPVWRCTCPSRQFPCKHSIGLMLAYADGKPFEKSDLPQDLKDKRDKALKKLEKKNEEKTDVEWSGEELGAEASVVKEKAVKPKKVNKLALQKKIQAQLEGLRIFEKIIMNICKNGLGTINKKTLILLEEQIKELGNYYISGVQVLLREFVLVFAQKEILEDCYDEAAESLVKLYAFSKRAIEHLEQKLSNPDLKNEDNLYIEELIGRAWQLTELKENNLVEYNAKLVQLAFNSIISDERKEFIDFGLWINLKTGNIDETRNYRPFKAAKYIKEEDSSFSTIIVPELLRYPGIDMNLRIRWNSFVANDIEESDVNELKKHAHKSYKDVLKLVKNQLKNPLSSKSPVMLIHVSKCGKIADDINDNGNRTSFVYAIEDETGQRITLKDDENEPFTLEFLDILGSKKIQNQYLLLQFHRNVESWKVLWKAAKCSN